MTRIDPAHLVPYEGDLEHEVRADADLASVLALLLDSRSGRVGVVDGDGRRVGAFTVESLHAAVRAAS